LFLENSFRLEGWEMQSAKQRKAEVMGGLEVPKEGGFLPGDKGIVCWGGFWEGTFNEVVKRGGKKYAWMPGEKNVAKKKIRRGRKRF